jgi:ribose transport system permease protein
MFYGLGQVMTNGYLVTVSQPSFSSLGNNSFAGVRYSIWLFLAVALSLGLILARTNVGKYIFAVGGNPEAARLSGVRVNAVRVTTFALSGLAAGMAGVLVASRISQGQADSGSDLTLTTIAAVVIGGTSILGGEGAVWRSVLGVLLLTMIGNGFNLLNVNSIYQQIVEGGIIVSAVAFDAWSRRSR